MLYKKLSVAGGPTMPHAVWFEILLSLEVIRIIQFWRGISSW